MIEVSFEFFGGENSGEEMPKCSKQEHISSLRGGELVDHSKMSGYYLPGTMHG